MASEFAPCTEAQKQAVLERLAVIRQRIAEACRDAGRPESFNVLLKEMQSLGLDVQTVKRTEAPKK